MSRRLRRHLHAALRPYHSNRSILTTNAHIRLPNHAAAAISRWSPGPGYIEAATASVWVKPLNHDMANAVVICYDWTDDTDRSVVASAVLRADDVVGWGRLNDKPHRLRHFSVEPPTIWEPERAALALCYAEQAHATAWLWDTFYSAHFRRMRGLNEQMFLTGTPDGGFKLTTGISVDRPHWDGMVPREQTEVFAHALGTLADTLGTGTRVTFSANRDHDLLWDPAYRRLRAACPAAFASPDEPLCDANL